MGVDSADRVTLTSLDERIELVGKLYKHTLKRSELRDELFIQISKQTRNAPERCTNLSPKYCSFCELLDIVLVVNLVVRFNIDAFFIAGNI